MGRLLTINNFIDTNGFISIPIRTKEDTYALFLNDKDFGVLDRSKSTIEYEVGGIEDIYQLSKTKFQWDKLNEIKKAMDIGLYKTALIAALTIPDICSKIAFPELKNKSEDECHRYKNWFDENVYKSEIGDHGKSGQHFDCLNGYMCYLLRCRLVHGDEKDIEELINRNESSFKKTDEYQRVYFRLIDIPNSVLVTIKNDKEEKYCIIFHSLPQLILSILCCADALYQKTENKQLFNDGCEIMHAQNIRVGFYGG